MQEEFAKWLEDRPQIIKDIAAKYPPYIIYKIKEGAPYGISCAGTTVYLRSYLETGNVGIVVMADHKLPQAIAHEAELGKVHGKTEAEMKEIHESNVAVTIDPIWLEPIHTNPN